MGGDERRATLRGLGVALQQRLQARPVLFSGTNWCKQGKEFEACHYLHRRQRKPRLCKGKRERFHNVEGGGRRHGGGPGPRGAP